MCTWSSCIQVRLACQYLGEFDTHFSLLSWHVPGGKWCFWCRQSFSSQEWTLRKFTSGFRHVVRDACESILFLWIYDIHGADLFLTPFCQHPLLLIYRSVVPRFTGRFLGHKCICYFLVLKTMIWKKATFCMHMNWLKPEYDDPDPCMISSEKATAETKQQTYKTWFDPSRDKRLCVTVFAHLCTLSAIGKKGQAMKIPHGISLFPWTDINATCCLHVDARQKQWIIQLCWHCVTGSRFSEV